MRSEFLEFSLEELVLLGHCFLVHDQDAGDVVVVDLRVLVGYTRIVASRFFQHTFSFKSLSTFSLSRLIRLSFFNSSSTAAI